MTRLKNIRFFYFSAFACWTAFALGGLILIADGDPHVFIQMGGAEITPNRFDGYDGQFAYGIARDPLGAHALMDLPYFRYQRILYPLMAWALSIGGSEVLLPWVLFGINVVAGLGSTWLLGRLFHRRGTAPWAAYSVTLFFGMVLSVLMDLNEPIALFLIVAGIDRFEQDHGVSAAILFAFAGLAKETSLIFPVGISMHMALSGKPGMALKFGTISILPLALWIVFLRYWLGGSMTDVVSLIHWVPFGSMQAIRTPELKLLGWAWVILPVLASVMMVLAALWRRRFSWQIWVLLGNVFFLAVLPDIAWRDLVAPYRYLLQYMVVALLLSADEFPNMFGIFSWNWGLSLGVYVLIA